MAALPKAHVPVAMALVVPTLLARAANEEGGEGEDGEGAVERETSARLLELAGVDQGAFRGVVGGMSESQRAFMEAVIRAGSKTSGRGGGEEENGGRPTIALKMDFGSGA